MTTPTAERLQGVLVMGLANLSIRPVVEDLPLQRRKFVRAKLRSGDAEWEATAYDRAAEKLAGLRMDQKFRFTGRLELTRWETGDTTKHQELAVVLTEVHGP